MANKDDNNVIFINSVDENGKLSVMKTDDSGVFHTISHEDAVLQGFGLAVSTLTETTLHFMKQSGVSSGQQFAHAFRMTGATAVVSFVVYNKEAEIKYGKDSAHFVAVAQTAGNMIFSMSGSLLGAEIGGGVGSTVPVLGTAVGAIGGSIVGGFVFGVAYDETKISGSSLKDKIGDFASLASKIFTDNNIYESLLTTDYLPNFVISSDIQTNVYLPSALTDGKLVSIDKINGRKTTLFDAVVKSQENSEIMIDGNGRQESHSSSKPASEKPKAKRAQQMLVSHYLMDLVN